MLRNSFFSSTLDRVLKTPVTVLSGANLISQVLLFVFTFVYAKFFTPEVFGASNIFLFPIQVLAISAAARYDLAIMNAKSEPIAARIAELGFYILCCTTVFVSLGLIFYLLLGTDQKNSAQLLLIPIGTFLIGLFQIFNYWLIRCSAFYTIAAGRIFQAVFGGVAPIIMYFFDFTVTAIILGAILARSSGLFVFLVLTSKIKIYGKFRDRGRGIPLRALAYKLSSFPLFSMPQAFVNTASLSAGPFVVALLINENLGGQFLMADRIMLFGTAVIGTSFGQVLLSACKGLSRPIDIMPHVIKNHRSLLSIGPPLLSVLAAGLYLFSDTLLGDKWGDIGNLALCLTISATFQLLASPLTVIVGLLNLNRQNLIIHIMLFVLRVFPLLFMCLFWPDRAILTYAMLSAIGYSFYLAWLIKITGVRFRDYFRNTIWHWLAIVLINAMVFIICLLP